MPKYFVKNFAGREHEVSLDSLLQPDNYHQGGAIEEARAIAVANSEAIGRLLAHFVQENKMSLDDAKKIAGIFSEVYVVNIPGID